MVPPPTLYGLPFLKIGGLQLSYPLLFQEQVKLRTSNLADMANQNKSPLKFWRKWSVGVSRDCPFFGGYPLLSRERAKLRTSNLAGRFTGTIRIKAYWKFRRKGSVGVSGECPIFWVPPIISGTGKATDFKFCRNIHRVDPNKSPWKMLGIVAVGVVRDTRNFSGHPSRPIGRIARSSLR